jgi:hypothetical protein
VDPTSLAQAIEDELSQEQSLDFRTRLLIRDSTDALEQHRGKSRLEQWLRDSHVRQGIEAIRREPLGELGFPLLKNRLVDKTDPETVREFLRDLGTHLSQSIELRVGGAVALILSGYLARSTTDFDIADEVPLELRGQHQLLNQLAQRYGLQLTHFQSHFLPAGWENRLHSHRSFGNLRVLLVDVRDLFVRNLFSSRAKDLDDLRALAPLLDKAALVDRLQASAASLLQDATLRPVAEKNWYILYGEPLPEGGPSG